MRAQSSIFSGSYLISAVSARSHTEFGISISQDPAQLHNSTSSSAVSNVLLPTPPTQPKSPAKSEPTSSTPLATPSSSTMFRNRRVHLPLDLSSVQKSNDENAISQLAAPSVKAPVPPLLLPIKSVAASPSSSTPHLHPRPPQAPPSGSLSARGPLTKAHCAIAPKPPPQSARRAQLPSGSANHGSLSARVHSSSAHESPSQLAHSYAEPLVSTTRTRNAGSLA
jgi:hypothetical protein